MGIRAEKIGVELIDVGGSFKRMCTEAPKLAKKLMGTAVFVTASSVLQHMESHAPEGPDGSGLTPDEHIRLDLTDNWKASRPLSAKVGILDNDAQAHVALYNEYQPNAQPFMVPAARANDSTLYTAAVRALQSLENKLASGAKG